MHDYLFNVEVVRFAFVLGILGQLRGRLRGRDRGWGRVAVLGQGDADGRQEEHAGLGLEKAVKSGIGHVVTVLFRWMNLGLRHMGRFVKWRGRGLVRAVDRKRARCQGGQPDG